MIRLRDIHWELFMALLALATMGSLFIYSASYHDSASYETRQIFWVMVGVVIFFSMIFVGYRSFLGVSYLLYAISIGFLLYVDIFGHTRLGAQRWMSLGPIVFQPSEFAKLATALSLAHYLGSHPPWEKQKRRVLTALGIGLLPFFMILKQPDLGSALLFLGMMGAVLLVWGIRYRYILLAILGTAGAVPFLFAFLKEYQKKRIFVFLDPSKDPLGAGYTAIQSKIAVGSGGMIGKGFLAGTQSQLQFVPEHHTDFIFCVISEEAGFFGACLILAFYGLLFKAAFDIMEKTTDVKARLLITGIIAVIFSQMFINIGMTFGIMPIAGVTLPLVSYGGSSFVASALSLGLILSVYKERSIF